MKRVSETGLMNNVAQNFLQDLSCININLGGGEDTFNTFTSLCLTSLTVQYIQEEYRNIKVIKRYYEVI